MVDFIKKNPIWAVSALVLVIFFAVLFNRPVKVSVFENVYIEVGAGEAGPPVYYEEMIDLEDGRKVIIEEDSCRIVQ